MADVFNRLSASRFADGVRRLLGEDLVIEQVSPEIVLGLSLDNLSPEWQVLFGIRPWVGQAQVAAGGAGNRSIAQLFNPTGSGIISVFLGFRALHTIAGAQVFDLRRDDAARGADSGNLVSRDTRTSVRNCTTQLRTVNNAAAPGGTTILMIDQIEAGEGANRWDNPCPIVIAPGVGIDIQPSVDNNALNVTVWGYERVARPEELALT